MAIVGKIADRDNRNYPQTETHHSVTPRRLVDTVDMEENKGKETTVRRKFDREVKNDPLRPVELSNRSLTQVAQELDILRSHPVQLDV